MLRVPAPSLLAPILAAVAAMTLTAAEEPLFKASFLTTGDFYVRHETSLNVLRSAGPLSLRVGVSNDYRSKPLPTQVKTE